VPKQVLRLPDLDHSKGAVKSPYADISRSSRCALPEGFASEPATTGVHYFLEKWAYRTLTTWIPL
jgi:hypothetical protein